VLPTWFLAERHGKLQPFGAFTHKNLAYLDDPAFNWDMGVNYLIDGHRAKLTFQYSLRPQFFERTEGISSACLRGLRRPIHDPGSDRPVGGAPAADPCWRQYSYRAMAVAVAALWANGLP
jgi:hypothetical protein